MKNELEKILQCALELFGKYGIKSVTMDDLSAKLGISKKTLYKHVKDKLDLVTCSLAYEMKHIENKFHQIRKSHKNAIMELIDLNKQIHQMIKNYNPSVFYDLKKYYPQLYRKFYLNSHKLMYHWIFNNIKKGKMEGLYRNNMNEEVIAKLYVSRVEGLREEELCNLHEFISKKFYNEILIYHIRGISNEKGIEEFEKYSNQFKYEKV